MDAQQKNQMEFLETLAENRRKDIVRLEGEVERYKAALTELCWCKTIKQDTGKTDEYLKRQPLAWEQAFEVLGLQTDKEVVE